MIWKFIIWIVMKQQQWSMWTCIITIHNMENIVDDIWESLVWLLSEWILSNNTWKPHIDDGA